MAMIRISGTMIVRNEAARLAACLDALRGVADEMIIVDTGSEDGTLEIARRYTDLCFEHPWTDDFAAARNAALAHATGDYVLVVDADEVIAEPKAAAEALRRFATLQDPCCAGTAFFTPGPSTSS